MTGMSIGEKVAFALRRRRLEGAAVNAYPPSLVGRVCSK